MIGKKPEEWKTPIAEMPIVFREIKILKEREILEMHESLLRDELDRCERCRCPRCNNYLAFDPNRRSYVCLNPDCSLFHHQKGEKG